MIIHSPIVSGSLTFANGATFTLPTGGVYSGSFSGSYQGTTFSGGTFSGDGSALTFGGTGIVSGSSQLTTEFDARYLNTGGDGIVSSSAQVITLLPTGTISGSSQVVNLTNGQLQNSSITIAGTSTSLGGSITAATILQGTGVVSGSSQITAGSTTNFATDVKTQLNSNTVVSGSSQIDGASLGSNKTITIGSTSITLGGTSTTIAGLSSVSSTAFTGALTGNASTATTLQTARTINGTSFDGSANITIANLVSGSSQIDLTATTNYASGIKTQLDSNTVVSGSAQIVGILSPLNTFSASQETKNNTLGTYTASLETKNNTLGNVTASLLSSQTNLNAYTGSLLNALQVTGSRVNFLGDVVIYGTQSIINSQNVEIADNILYLAPTASIDNDLGIVGHYNDGTYRHAGIFMDASDGHAWKVFNGLQGETTATIDTAGTGFTLADFKGGAFTGTSFTGIHNGTINATNGVVSGSSQIAFSGVTGTVSNAQLANSAITIAGTSTSLGGSITLSTITNGSGIFSGSAQVTGLTNSNLSGTAGISNANLANSSVTVTAGSGLSGGGAVSLGGSVSLANAGVTSNVAGTGVSVSGATGAVTISIGQAVATTSNVQFNSLGIGMAASATAGRIDATNDIVAYSSSDIRFKENITPIENAIDKINQIGGYTYDWKEENKIEHGYDGNDVGVIAQEIEAVLPQLVQTRESGYKAVKYDKLVALLIEGIKEQQFQIDELRNKIEKLENGK